MNVQKLHGNWKAGWALDLHTISSIPSEGGRYITKRTEIGEALYLFKYRSDEAKLSFLANSVNEFLKTRLVTPYLTTIIPVPPSNINRPFQPVLELALEIGRLSKITVRPDLVQKIKETKPIKGIESGESRRGELHGAFKVKDKSMKNRKVLLFDDLFRSGETLAEIARVLYKQGCVQNVYALTLTKTRVKK